MPHDAEMATKIEERMRPLRALYFDSLRQRMQVIEHALVMLVSHEFHEASDQQALMIEAHKLAGNGATYGFPLISDAARALERALLIDAAGHERLLSLAASLLDVCHDALAEHISMTSQASAASVSASAVTEPDSHDQASVLVADDDEAVRALLADKLPEVGCQVVCAEDGDKAWQLLQTHSFSLAVLDLMMPGHDGMTLLRMMQSHAQVAPTPVVFLTARHLSSDVLAGLNGGAADYITKPFHVDELVTRCKRLLPPSGRRSECLTATRRRNESTADC